MRHAAALFVLSLTCSLCAHAHAQQAGDEAPDPTRLDVERLPPEAIAVKRDMFASGFFVQNHIGGRGFAGGVGKLSQPGVFARVDLGYELFSWLVIGGAFELSLHQTNAPAPPVSGNFQLIDAMAQVRLQLPIWARATPYLAAEGGIAWSTGSLLQAYGVEDANKLMIAYGGSLGFDWHLLTRHVSMGLLAGARLYPNLTGFGGEKTLGIHSAVNLKYVF